MDKHLIDHLRCEASIEPDKDRADDLHCAADRLEFISQERLRLSAENERLVDRVDLLEGVVKTCHLAFVEIPEFVLEEREQK